MSEKTDAQKRAQKAYMGKFSLITVRVSPDKKKAVEAHADAQGESINAFVNRAIDETMERDNSTDLQGKADRSPLQ